MNSVRAGIVVAVVVFSGALGSRALQAQAQQPPAGGGNGGGGGKGWTIPAGAAQEPNPLPASDDVLQKGKKVYGSKCQRCHGTAGKGDGPDADPDTPPDDLSDSSRAARNPDGVMFYKIWNGRKSPKMPAQSEELSKDDVWAVVHYAKSLRK
jgi:mono/diheme cytochrome c family protein